jgi:nifR3 family TIM-barrel protein
MDGITDMAFRELVAQRGGSGALYCEFINVKGLIYQNPKTVFELRYTENQRPIIAQLFGNDPDDFYEAAKLIVRMGFDGIDINMGCPAHKVASKGCGCALMDNLANAKRIVEKTVEGANEEYKNSSEFANLPVELQRSYKFPVTTKMRLGVSDKSTVFTHGMAMIESGSQAVAIHGRTLKQMYTGEADWEPIKKFKEIVDQSFDNDENKPKVFGSGDVKSLYEAFVRVITTGVDGVMIGRGSFGNPWVFDKNRVDAMRQHIINTREFFQKEIIDMSELESLPTLSKIKSELENISQPFEEVKNVAVNQAELLLADKGEKGILQMRKHLAWYFGGFPGAKELRSQLVLVKDVEEIKTILNNFQIANSL